MTTVGIIQPNFLPWRGYFDFVSRCDLFVFLDDAQYTSRDWRNRNRIRLPDGRSRWLTVPVKAGPLARAIDEVPIDHDTDWRRRHLATLRHSYGRAPHHEEVAALLAASYDRAGAGLADFTIALTRDVMRYLGIATPCLRASELGVAGRREARLLDIVRHLGGTRYLSGPAARAYIDPESWRAAGLALEWMDYAGYPEYPQIAAPFDPRVSIVDLLFMKGPRARDYLHATGGTAR